MTVAVSHIISETAARNLDHISYLLLDSEETTAL
jgi:hypothetical protein